MEKVFGVELDCKFSNWIEFSLSYLFGKKELIAGRGGCWEMLVRNWRSVFSFC